MKLIPNWRKAHKMASIQIASFGATVTLAWNALPESLRDHLPPWLATTAACGVFTAVILARLIYQPKVSKSENDTNV